MKINMGATIIHHLIRLILLIIALELMPFLLLARRRGVDSKSFKQERVENIRFHFPRQLLLIKGIKFGLIQSIGSHGR